MSNFYCEHCGATMYDDDKKGYTNGCIHYPLKKRDQIDEKKLSPLEVMLRSMVGK